MAASSTAWRKYARALVDSAAMRAMTSVPDNWRSEFRGSVTSFNEAAC